MTQFLSIYLILINTISFLFMGLDKLFAVKKMFRFPEKSLFAVALLGGALGSCIAMFLFRHKTKHRVFLYGLPIIFAIQTIAVYLIIK